MRGRVTVGGEVLAHLEKVKLVDARSETQRAADAAGDTLGMRPVTVEWQQTLTDKEAAEVEMLFDSIPRNLPGRVQVTLPHDATPEQIEQILEGLREMFAPEIALDVVRAPAPPAVDTIGAAIGGRVDEIEEPTAYALARGPHDEPVCICPGVPPRGMFACEVEDDPRYCKCPTCGTRWRTPVHHVLGVLALVTLASTIRSRAVDVQDANRELERLTDLFGVR